MEDNPEIIVLEKFYTNLYTNLIKKYKKERYKSIIKWFLDIKSNDRMRILKESSIKKVKLPKEQVVILVKEELIRETECIGEYIITAKGLWNYEKYKGLMSEKDLIDYLDDKYFNSYSCDIKQLSDRQKIIIFSMIATRTFSEESPVDLKLSEVVLNSWENIIKRSYEFLRSLKLVSELSDEQIFGKQGPEHKVSNLIRHSDEIPKRTKGIYKTAKTRDQKYYLDIYSNNKIDQDHLKFLFKIIFGDKKLTHNEIDLICKFCNEIATTQNVYVFDVKTHIFHEPRFDDILRDALITL